MSENFQRGLVLSDAEVGAETQRKNFGRWSLIIGLIFVVGLAAFLRFYRLNDLPPGMWFDEAWSAVAARDTAAQGSFPPYFAASFGGMHPAIVYLTRFANLFTNGHPLTIRYALAVVGTLTVLLSFFSYRAILGLTIDDLRLTIGASEQSSIVNVAPRRFAQQSSIITLLGAFILAITFPFLLFTRMGFESSLVAPASLLVFWCLAVALGRGTARWYGLTGAVLGLSLYSFDTARFLPFAVSFAYWGVVLIYRREEGWRRHMLNFVWLTLAALVVFVPLGTYFIQNWGQFTERAGVTTYNTFGPGAESVPLALLNNAWRTIGGLSLPGFGDVIARHNLPGRPVFDVFLSILFWLGVGVLIWQWKRPFRQAQGRPFAIILISWAGVMLLPVILTDGAPTYTRIFGAIPALAGIAALSFCIPTLLRLRSDGLRVMIYGVLGGMLLLSLVATTFDYFVRWAKEPALFDQFQVADWQAANLAKERLKTGVVYLVPDLVDEAHPTFDLVLGGSEVRSFPANCMVVQAGGKRPLTYLIQPSSAPDTLSVLQTIHPEGKGESSIISPLTGEKLFITYTSQSPISNLQSPIAQFGDAIQLLAQPEIEMAESTVTIPLTWQAIGRPATDHTYFIHLYRTGAEDEPPVAQLDQQPCLPTSQWHEGEIVMETAVLSLPADLPPGTYTLGLGWYTWPSFERLPLTSHAAVLPDQRLIIEELLVE